MKPSRGSGLAAFAVALGAAVLGAAPACSGPSEYTNPRLEPEPTASPPVSSALADSDSCVPEGKEITGAPDAGPSPPCCPGLTRVGTFKGSILRLDDCEPEGNGHAFCIKCGDGVCGIGENACSCAADCHLP
jgi:hypothetical protein